VLLESRRKLREPALDLVRQPLGRSWREAAALLLVFAIGGIACKSDPARLSELTCEKVYAVCPSLPRPTAQEVTACGHVIDGSFGTAMRQYLRCVTGKCDDAGLIDQLAIAAECGPIIEAYRECEPTDGGVPADRRDDPPPLTSAYAPKIADSATNLDVVTSWPGLSQRTARCRGKGSSARLRGRRRGLLTAVARSTRTPGSAAGRRPPTAGRGTAG
jgi:hypothetical protein